MQQPPRDAVKATRILCRDPVQLFHPTQYDRDCVANRVEELVLAVYELQRRHKASELRHAAECHETAMCVLGYDHPLARLMEDDVDSTVRQKTIENLTPSHAWSSPPPNAASPWLDALAVMCCETGKPRKFAILVEALLHSSAIKTERGTIWILWLCALSCLVFPLDETHVLTRPLIDSVICTLARKTPPTSSFSPIEECVLTICFLASRRDECGTLRVWSSENLQDDRDLRLEALVKKLHSQIAVGKANCREGNELLT